MEDASNFSAKNLIEMFESIVTVVPDSDKEKCEGEDILEVLNNKLILESEDCSVTDKGSGFVPYSNVFSLTIWSLGGKQFGKWDKKLT